MSDGPLSDEKQGKRQRKRERYIRIRQEADFRAVMAMPAGRRVMWALLDGLCGILKQSFTGNSETFYREGRRSVGLDLWQELQRVAPSEFVQMFTEQLQHTKDEELSRQSAEAAEAEKDE